MRLSRSCLVVFAVAIFLFCSISSWAQSEPAGRLPVRDPQAVVALQGALVALGGKDAQLRVHTAVIRGIIQAADGQAAVQFLWEDDLSSKMPEFRKEIGSGDSGHLLVSGHGTPAQQKAGVQSRVPWQASVALTALYLPGVVLARRLDDPAYSVQWISDSSGLTHVRTCWELNLGTAAISAEDWYLDPGTKLPVRVAYPLPNTESPGQVKSAVMEFSDFRPVSGIRLPFTIVGRDAAQQVRKFAVTDAEINTPINPADFQLRGGQQ